MSGLSRFACIEIFNHNDDNNNNHNNHNNNDNRDTVLHTLAIFLTPVVNTGCSVPII